MTLLLPVALLLTACMTVEHTAADLQLDVAAPLPAAAAVVRVCVEGQGVHEEGAGNGRIAVPALRADEPATLVVQVDDAEGTVLETAAVDLDSDRPYAEVGSFVEPFAPCTTEGAWARDDAESWLLAVRFAEAPA